uniref:TBCC domain-containing protein 1 n=1 Tax=Ananas comosus var. bracteatus TaxID=296719 RepID=A0A6V7QS17_ANACO
MTRSILLAAAPHTLVLAPDQSPTPLSAISFIHGTNKHGRGTTATAPLLHLLRPSPPPPSPSPRDLRARPPPHPQAHLLRRNPNPSLPQGHAPPQAHPIPHLVDAPAFADALDISLDHARLALQTLAAVLPSDPGAAAAAADVHDLLLFLYVQSYKRLLPKAHKDPTAVADVWPSTSAFDAHLSALSLSFELCPKVGLAIKVQLILAVAVVERVFDLQNGRKICSFDLVALHQCYYLLLRSSTRRFIPSQADEETHQLSYLQKHLGNILALLADSVEYEGDESLVLTAQNFEHLEFLIQVAEKGSEGVSLSQAAPFFANSDPEMPDVPVPAAQVHDWLLQHISASLEHAAETEIVKDNGLVRPADQDVPMADASVNSTGLQNNVAYSRSQVFVEGFYKTSVVKQAHDIKGDSIKVLNCHDSIIYTLAPLRYATVYGCSDATIVVGAVGKALRVEHCERVQVISVTRRICIANCRECVFYLGVNEQPLILGDNHKLKVAPYNTYYSQLDEHMAQVGIDATVNRWDEPLVLGMVDPHDPLSHPAGVSDVQAESATCLDPDQFSNFLIPSWFGTESAQTTKQNPFSLPESYRTFQNKSHSTLQETQQVIRDVQLEKEKKRELLCALHMHFKDWLYASGHIRQLYCLQSD